MSLLTQLRNHTQHLKILYVEDDLDLRSKMNDFFSALFAQVDLAENGRKGLEQFTRHIEAGNDPYDIIITDVNMPKMNGIDMIKEIYATHPRQPVIVMSAHDETDYLLKLLNIGVNSFILKPAPHDVLIKTLYGVADMIINQKLVARHYHEIEKLNSELSLAKEALEKSNDELREKNIALEKSLRIIEGIHHRDQLQRPVDYTPVKRKHPEEPTKPADDTIPLKLQAIDEIIDEISQTYLYKGIADSSLISLSDAIRHYADDLHERKILQAALFKLAEHCGHQPGCTSSEELERTFSMLESFFFIYKKWHKEWANMKDVQFERFCESMAKDIDVLIDVWECRV
jgi:YesN/AraC family two-component response regulator